MLFAASVLSYPSSAIAIYGRFVIAAFSGNNYVYVYDRIVTKAYRALSLHRRKFSGFRGVKFHSPAHICE